MSGEWKNLLTRGGAGAARLLLSSSGEDEADTPARWAETRAGAGAHIDSDAGPWDLEAGPDESAIGFVTDDASRDAGHGTLRSPRPDRRRFAALRAKLEAGLARQHARTRAMVRSPGLRLRAPASAPPPPRPRLRAPASAPAPAARGRFYRPAPSH